MNIKLNSIQNWPELARQANWCATTLAKRCGISRDTLLRYFLERFGKTTKAWLAEQRQQQAIELLRDGSSIKETAAYMGYKQQTNFTRKFKEYWGACPSLPPPPTTTPIRIAPK